MKEKINNTITGSDSILLLTHERPDGDAVGSVLSIYNYLVSINKKVDMVIIDSPVVFSFLPGFDMIKEDADSLYDLGIVVDCATKERIGQKKDLLTNCKSIINIDHHISNTNYGDINYVFGEVSSCCQVIYNLLKSIGIDFSANICSALAAGMITDTNGFRNNNVDGDTFMMAADLVKYDIDFHKIYERVLFNKSLAKHNLMKIALDRLEFLCDGKIAFTYVLKDDFNIVGAEIGDHEGIVDIGRSIDGVLVSVFIREDIGYTISLRSTGVVDVNQIACVFGGGGHKMAAGCKTNMKFEETKNLIVDEIKKVIM